MMKRHASGTHDADRPEDDAGAGRPRLSGWRRRWAMAVAALGVAATVVAGFNLFAVQPRVDRFFGPGTASPRAGGRLHASASAPAAEPSRPTAPRPAPETLVVPVPGPVILAYGWTFSPTLSEWRFHSAVDLAGRMGQPVAAAAAGKVTAVRASRLYGGVVGLDVGGGESCLYEGLAKVDVQVGQQVRAGQELGIVGPSPAAESSEPPHVHWQVVRDGKPVNPESLHLSKAPAA